MPWSDPLARLLTAGIAMQRGDRPTAVAQLQLAVSGFEAAEMGMYATAARRRLGQVLGGEQGRGFIESATAAMSSRHVQNPARLTAMLAPGFPE
jgi:hypothetical protein